MCQLTQKYRWPYLSPWSADLSKTYFREDDKREVKPLYIEGFLMAVQQTYEKGEVSLHMGEEENREFNEKAENIRSLYTILDQCIDSILCTDKEFRITYINKAAIELFGWRLDEIKGKMPDIINAEPDSKAIQQEIYSKISSGQTYCGELKNIRKNGELFYCQFKVSALFDEEGKIYGYIGIQRDVTEHKLAEKALKESEEKYRSLITNIPDMVWTISATGGVSFVSPNVEKILGFSAKEIYQAGSSLWLESIHPDDSDRVKKEYASLFQGNTAYDTEYRIQKKDGEWIWIHNRAVAVYERDGLIYADGITSDITARKRIERSLQKEKEFTDMALNSQMDVFIVFDPLTGKALRWNDAFRRISGYSDEEIAALKAPDSYYSREDLKKAENAIQKLFETGHCTCEISFLTKEGNIIPFEYKATMIEDKETGKKYIVSIGRDITERKKSEESLKAALIRAQEADNLKSAFLANMSHEIRTPLNPIIGYTDLMLADDISEEHKEYLHIMKESGNLLLSIIDDILDLSKIEAGQLKIEQIPFRLTAMFDAIHSTFHTLISQKGKDIVLRQSYPDTISDRIIGDPFRIRQLMNNLLGNAIKFTDQGFIEYGVSLKDKNTLEFYVRDTGIGIPPDKQKDIFKPFQQADVSHTRRYGGTGLGLTITERLVKLIGGEISFCSDVGQEHGTVFFFTIPYRLAPGEEQMNGPEMKVLESKGGYTILIAEDNLANQKIARKILEKSGYRVIPTQNGREAISLYKTDPSIHLILMDVQMPVLDGLEATKIIRKMEIQEKKKSRMPIIGLTAYAMKGDKEKCLEAGMDDYIAKPIKADELLTRVENMIAMPHSKE